MFGVAIEAGANDIYKEEIEDSDESIYIIETNIENMLQVVAELTKSLNKEPKTAEWFWKANDYLEFTDKDFIEKYQKLFDSLDDLDDITEVYSNADI